MSSATWHFGGRFFSGRKGGILQFAPFCGKLNSPRTPDHGHCNRAGNAYGQHKTDKRAIRREHMPPVHQRSVSGASDPERLHVWEREERVSQMRPAEQYRERLHPPRNRENAFQKGGTVAQGVSSPLRSDVLEKLALRLKRRRETQGLIVDKPPDINNAGFDYATMGLGAAAPI